MKYSRIQIVKDIAQNIEMYSPILIIGQAGSGKSFFLETLCKELKQIGKINRYDIVESWDFIESLAKAIRSNRVEAWRKRILHQEIFIYDDFDFCEKNEQAQEELLHIFKSSNKPRIIASNCKIEKYRYSDELVQYFKEAMIIDLDSPIYRITYEDTREYLKSQIKTRAVHLTDEAYSWLINQKFDSYATVRGLTKILSLNSRFDRIDFSVCYVLTKQYLADPDVDRWIHDILMAKFTARSATLED